jgi:hypothetical protein
MVALSQEYLGESSHCSVVNIQGNKSGVLHGHLNQRIARCSLYLLGLQPEDTTPATGTAST